jgi:hypothetical protein
MVRSIVGTLVNVGLRKYQYQILTTIESKKIEIMTFGAARCF